MSQPSILNAFTIINMSNKNNTNGQQRPCKEVHIIHQDVKYKNQKPISNRNTPATAKFQPKKNNK